MTDGVAIPATVDETLTKLGIEPTDHREMQEDMIFLRRLRNTSETVKSRSIVVLVGTIITGMIAAVWIGLRSMLSGGSP